MAHHQDVHTLHALIRFQGDLIVADSYRFVECYQTEQVYGGRLAPSHLFPAVSSSVHSRGSCGLPAFPTPI